MKIGETMGVLHSFAWNYVKYANMEDFRRDSHKWSIAASLQKWPFYQCCYTVQWSSWLWKFYYINKRQQYFWIWFLSHNTWLMWWLLIFLMAMPYCVLEKIYWCMHELYTRVQVTICSFTIKFIVFNCWHFNAWFVHPQITFGTCDPQYFIGIVSVIFFHEILHLFRSCLEHHQVFDQQIHRPVIFLLCSVLCHLQVVND